MCTAHPVQQHVHVSRATVRPQRELLASAGRTGVSDPNHAGLGNVVLAARRIVVKRKAVRGTKFVRDGEAGDRRKATRHQHRDQGVADLDIRHGYQHWIAG